MLLHENLYGDVVSDLCAGLIGGLGLVPGANIGDREAVHGSAPDIAGKNVANPLALLMSAVMMLNHIGDTQNDSGAKAVAGKIKNAYDQALTDGCKTRDLGGKLNCDAFADAVNY